MIRLSSILMLVAGLALIGYGLYAGISALGDLYQGALDAPLDQPPDAEQNTRGAMLRAALIGAAGIPALLLGKLFLARDLARKRRNKRSD
ncbi:MAG: hypothetical protein ACF8R7_00935 [Phycisphaerales bacterium JB039]